MGLGVVVVVVVVMTCCACTARASERREAKTQPGPDFAPRRYASLERLKERVAKLGMDLAGICTSQEAEGEEALGWLHLVPSLQSGSNS